MDKQHIRDELIRNLRIIAPEVDGTTLSDQALLREQVDLDSMDWLNFIQAVHKNLQVDIPEADYARLATLQQLIDYLEGRLGSAPH